MIVFFLNLLLALLIHEAAHSAAARLCGVPLRDFRVHPLGARLCCRRMLSYRQELLICAAGPLMNFLCWFVCRSFGAFSVFSKYSLGFALVNLLPAGNLDGGRILYCITASVFGLRPAEKLRDGITLLLSFCLWTFSVFFLLRFCFSLSLFVFAVSIFVKVFVNRK